MKTIVLSTLTQTIIATVFFTLAGIVSTGLVTAQILFFITHFMGIVFPLVLLNLIEFALLSLLFNKTELHNTNSTMFLLSLFWGIGLGTFVLSLEKQQSIDRFGFYFSPIEFALIVMFFWFIMSLIFTYFFKRHRKNTLIQD